MVEPQALPYLMKEVLYEGQASQCLAMCEHLCLFLGVPQHHQRLMGDQPGLWLRIPMGHGVHDTISEPDQKFSPNFNCELVGGKKDEQLVQSCKLWLSTKRQVNVMYLLRVFRKRESLVTYANKTIAQPNNQRVKFHYSSLQTTLLLSQNYITNLHYCFAWKQPRVLMCSVHEIMCFTLWSTLYGKYRYNLRENEI